MRKVVFAIVLIGFSLFACKKNYVENETNPIRPILSAHDPIVEEYSEFGVVTMPTQVWIDNNATHPNYTQEGDYYILTQYDGRIFELYAFEDESELPPSLAPYYDKAVQRGSYFHPDTGKEISFITCVDGGNACHVEYLDGGGAMIVFR